MPPIERICKITGQKFLVSEFEQKLRQDLNVPLPDIHPTERQRLLLAFRNISTLYNDNCDLCGQHTLSAWGDNPEFPVYCAPCWWSDKWQPPQLDLDMEKPFFDQFKELVMKSPHLARSLVNSINSEYSNAATAIKNCYMCFNIGNSEDCVYVYGSVEIKNSIDCVLCEGSEILYDCVGCHKCYQMAWSEFSTNCRDSYFLYDCADCGNCALSTGLRHKSHVFLNEQLSPEEYEQKAREFRSGSHEIIEKYRQRFKELKKKYPKKHMIGVRNENVSGNLIFDCKNVFESYHASRSENCVNLYNVWNAKDCLDLASFGGQGVQRIYHSGSVGNNCYDVQFSNYIFGDCYNIFYSFQTLSSHDCFGCSFISKTEYRILNKPYKPEEYKRTVEALKQKMIERGENYQMFRPDIIPFAYNESVAHEILPLTKEEALKRGFRWLNRPLPKVPESQIITPPDRITDIEWPRLEGKILICDQSKRPYKIIKQEFEFYKRFNLPIPRLHPEVRRANRFPREMMFNEHRTNCSNCNIELATSMSSTEKVLCDTCYTEAMT